MAFWTNLLGYQATWFTVVWSAGHGRAWIGMLACVAFIAWQLSASRTRVPDVRVLFAALACGCVIEGLAASTGLLHYASPKPALLAIPVWILLLWGAFAMTLNHSMRWFAQRPWPAATFAAIGGPLAYLAAARTFGGVAFPRPAWPTLLWLAAGWGVALPILLSVARRPTHVRSARRRFQA